MFALIDSNILRDKEILKTQPEGAEEQMPANGSSTTTTSSAKPGGTSGS